MRFLHLSTPLLTCVLLLVPASIASADLVYNNGVGNTSGVNISGNAFADDFVLSSPATITRIRVWLGDVNSDIQTSGHFGGTLGWAIHANASGKPGTVLFSGSDSSITLIADGTALNNPKYIADIDVSPVVALVAGTYWLQLREGSINSAFDGSDIDWINSVSQQGSVARFDTNETNPTTWNDSAPFDAAFQLHNDVQQAVPEPSTLCLLGLGGIGLVGYAWRKRKQKAA